MITFSHQARVNGPFEQVCKVLLTGCKLPKIQGFTIESIGRQAGDIFVLFIREEMLGRTVGYQMSSKHQDDYHIVWEQLDPGHFLHRTIHWYLYPQNGGALVAYRFEGRLTAASMAKPLIRRLTEKAIFRHLEALLIALKDEIGGDSPLQEEIGMAA